MIHFTCVDCQMGFQAQSAEEALEQALKEGKKGLELEDLSYAKQCPYCSSKAIEER